MNKERNECRDCFDFNDDFKDNCECSPRDCCKPGPRGPKGDRGCPGPMGPRGPKGDCGNCGCKGDKGDCGCKGDKGDCGPRGPQGPFGPQGPAGEKGCKGDCGDCGHKGDCGERGPMGPKGPKGDGIFKPACLTAYTDHTICLDKDDKIHFKHFTVKQNIFLRDGRLHFAENGIYYLEIIVNAKDCEGGCIAAHLNDCPIDTTFLRIEPSHDKCKTYIVATLIEVDCDDDLKVINNGCKIDLGCCHKDRHEHDDCDCDDKKTRHDCCSPAVVINIYKIADKC